MSRRRRIGMIVPSSNTTMELELPELFRRRERTAPERFGFHSSRMRMTRITPEALAAMDADSDRCAEELADADCDVVAYGCVVATMAGGAGAHIRAEDRLERTAAAAGVRHVPVVTSAGALTGALGSLGARRVALIAPYVEALTERVVDYLGSFGIEVVDAISLGISDNRAAGHVDPQTLVTVSRGLHLARADAVVLSACVQMPSLPAIPRVEGRTGLPTLSAGTATAFEILRRLRLPPLIEGAGRLLAAADRIERIPRPRAGEPPVRVA
jgi:maleate isomerase